MNELKEQTDIRNLIYKVRGVKVMLDSDLAFLYGCTNGTKDINKAVKRNIERFPSNFYFQLTKEEFQNLKFQIGTSNIKEHGGIRKLPYVFTEQGVAMLSSVLRTKNAAKISVNIMNAFVYMRRFINENKDIFKRVIEIENDTSYIKNALIDHEGKINEIFNKFERKEDLKNKLFFDGEIYDAYSLLVDIINESDKEIIIIDNYIDKVTLDILSKKKINVVVLLITDDKKSKLTKTDINKFNSEYPTLKIKYTNIFHDRFIIIDNNELYHLGASLKDLGKKVFAISKIEDKNYLNLLINMIKCL